MNPDWEIRRAGSPPAGASPPPAADTTPNVVSKPLFRFLLELESRKAVRLRYSIALVTLSIHNGKPNTSVTDRAHVEWTCAQAARLFRTTDVVTVLSPRTMGALLIDAETPTLPAIVTRLTDAVMPGLGTADSAGTDLSWSAGGASFPRDARSAPDLLRQAHSLMVRARTDGGRRLYLPT